jgi:hypothetical protein
VASPPAPPSVRCIPGYFDYLATAILAGGQAG